MTRPSILALVVLLGLHANTGAESPTDSVIVEVSSGGVSMGSYQGGYLLGRGLRRDPSETGRARVLTGASAGAINALGGLHHAFHPLRSGSSWSPWTEWLRIDWADLAGSEFDAVEPSLLSTVAIRAALDRVVDSLLAPPDPVAAGSEVQIGFAITRFLPENVLPALDVRSAAEKIVLRVRWRDTCPDPERRTGCYQVWSTGFGTIAQGGRRAVNHLWFGPHGTDTGLIRRNLVGLALASSAYPFAFPPAHLRIYAWDGARTPGTGDSGPGSAPTPREAGDAWSRHFLEGRRTGIRMTDSDSAVVVLDDSSGTLVFRAKMDPEHGRWTRGAPVKFSDGGLFENQPLELALKIAEDPGGVGAGRSFGAIRMLSPLHYRLHPAPSTPWRDMTSEWVQVLMGRPDPTSQELLRALERVNVDPARIELNTTVLPMATDHVRHFSGFFELRFRRFDFLAGFLDAFPSASDDSSFAVARRALEGFEGFRWASRVLDLESPGPSPRPLLRSIREVADRLQIEANTNGTVDLAPLDSARRILDGSFQTLLRAALEAERPDLADLDALEILQVLSGSLEQLSSSLRRRNVRGSDTEARRYEAFRRGLHLLSPCAPPGPSRGPGRCLELRRHPVASIDDLYLQTARFLAHDALEAPSAIVYPAALHHARTLMGLEFGDRPRWTPPYLRVEGANPGFRLLQGFSVLPRQAPPLPLLQRLRWEVGLHATWKSAPSQFWMPLRLGMEFPVLPGVRWLSLFPSWTVSVPLTDSVLAGRPGVDLLLLDVAHLRLDAISRGRPEITAGIRTGFDPIAIARGLANTAGRRSRAGGRRSE